METIYGVNCIKGEVHSLMTILRWSSRGMFSSKNLSANHDTINTKHSSIISEFGELSDNIKDVFDLHNLNCCIYLEPFCRLVISQKASGPLTCGALNSLSKFVLYGFLSSNFPGAKQGVNMVAYAISNCIFDETDAESDEIILMKLLELATMTFRSDSSGMLTVFNAWRMYETCLAIYGQMTSSKVLRSEAETCLRHLTLTTFGDIHDTFVDCSSEPVVNTTPVRPINSLSAVSDEAKKAYWETAKDLYIISNPVGMTLFLSKLLTVLSGYLDSRTQSPEFIRLSLSLVNVALEAGGPSLGKLPIIVDILRQDICRYLLVATQSDDMIIFNLTLRVVFNLFVSIKEHMKVQLEVFLNSVHIRMLQTARTDVNTHLHARTEMVIESLLEFANEPLVLQDLYVNYDCDVKCTNLYETIINVLCSNCLPTKLKSLNILDDIIDDDEFLDELSTASTKPRKHIPTPGSARHNGSGSDAYSVFHRINATESISKDVKHIYNSNNHIWFHRVDGVQKLAIDGVLTVLRSLADMCYVDADVHANPMSGYVVKEGHVVDAGLENSKSNDIFSYLHQQQESSNSIRYSSIRSASSSNVTPTPESRGGDVERSIDLWCSELEDEHLNYVDFDNSTVATHDMYGTASRNSNTVPVPIGLNGGAFKRAVPVPYRRSVSVTSENDVNLGAEPSVPVIEAHSKASAEVLKQRKLKKQRLSLVVDLFNAKPLKDEWSKLAIKMNLLAGAYVNSEGVVSPSHSDNGSGSSTVLADSRSISTSIGDPREVALFLRQTAGLNKTKIGEFISRGPADVYPYTALVLKEYVATFDFKGSSFDNALRGFLGAFMLPGEAQCIDRLMETFAQKLFDDLGPNNPFVTADAAFILSFSTIMLNTDLHNPQIQESKRMKMSDFVRNNSTINGGKDLPLEYIQDLYNNIKNNEIKLDLDASGANNAESLLEDMNGWNALISKNTELQAPPVFTPAAAARNLNGHRFFPVQRGKFDSSSMASSPAPSLSNGCTGTGQVCENPHVWPGAVNIYQKDMFMVLAKPVLNCLLIILERCYLTDNYFVKILEGLLDFAKLCECFELNSLLDRMLIALYCSIRRISEHRELKEKRDKEHFAVDHFKIDDLLSRSEFSGMKTVLSFDLVDIIRHSNDRRYHRSEAFTGSDGGLISSGGSSGSVNKTPVSPKQVPVAPVAVLSSDYQPVQNNKLRLIGSVHIRSEIMLKLVFYVLSHHASCISGNGWEVIYAVLLWLRDKGLLGDTARLSQVYQLGVVFKEHNRVTSKLPEDEFASLTFNQISIYEKVCHKCAMGIAIPNYSTGEPFLSTTASVDDKSSTGVFTNLWSAFTGDDAQGAGNAVELQYDEVDRYISHYTWNSSVSWYRHNIGGIISRNMNNSSDIWNSYFLMKHTMQAYDVIELTYNKDPSESQIAGFDESEGSTPNPVSTSLLKVSDIQVSNVQFSSLLYLVRSLIVELTDVHYAVITTAVNSCDHPMERDSSNSNESTTSLPDSSTGCKTNVSKQQLDVAFLLDVSFRVLVSNIYAVVSVVYVDNEVLTSNLHVVCGMYRRLISLFDLVLDEHVAIFCTHYPYIVERISVLTLDMAAVVVNSLAQLPCSTGKSRCTVGFNSPSKPQPRGANNSGIPVPPTPTPAAAAVKLPNSSTISEIMWYSLSLLRNISAPVFGNLSYMFGQGLSCFVLLSSSLNMLEDLDLQNWCILFSLLSLAARIPGVGRQHVWDSICHLLDHNHVNSANFTQYRRLLLRYLHGVFPGEVEEEQKQKLLLHSGHKPGVGSGSVPGVVEQGGVDHSFVAPAMIRLAKLTLMALAGESRSGHMDQKTLDEFETYPCPVLSMAYSSDMLAPGQDRDRDRSALLKYQNYFRFIAAFTCRDEFYHMEKGISPQAVQETLMQTVRLTHIKVRPVFFVNHVSAGGDSEVGKLWLETCKMFSEIVLMLINDVSEQGLYCIQVLFIAGRKIVAPPVWGEVLTDMIDRLPLKLEQFSMNIEPDHEAPGYLSDSVKEQMVSIALHGCSTIFEALIDSFDDVIGSSSLLDGGKLSDNALEYVRQIWSPFIDILAANARMLNSTQLSFGGSANITANDEIHDMIGALFKLLLGYIKMHRLEVVKERMLIEWSKCINGSKGLKYSFSSKLVERYPTVVHEMSDTGVDMVSTVGDVSVGSMVRQLWAPRSCEDNPSHGSSSSGTTSVEIEIESPVVLLPVEPTLSVPLTSTIELTASSRDSDSGNSTLFTELSEIRGLPEPPVTPTKDFVSDAVNNDVAVKEISPAQQTPIDSLPEPDVDTYLSSPRIPNSSVAVSESVISPASLLSAALGESDQSAEPISSAQHTPFSPQPPSLIHPVHSISRNNIVVSSPVTPLAAVSSKPVTPKSVAVNRQVNRKINYSKQFTV